MKIQIISDIHYDHWVNKREEREMLKSFLYDRDDADILMIAGDIAVDYPTFCEVLINLSQYYKHVVYTLGNHDIWTNEDSMELYNLKKNFEYKNIHCVDQSPFEIEDIAIVGNMGWYDYSTKSDEFTDEELDRMTINGSIMNDRNFVTGVGTNKEFAKKLDRCLFSDLFVVSGKESVKKIITMSHMVPLKIFMDFKKNKEWRYMNAFFGNDNIGQMVLKNKKVIAHVYGHTHMPSRRKIKGREFICNPIGYPSENLSTSNWKKKYKNEFLMV